jgi:hypothetical protein
VFEVDGGVSDAFQNFKAVRSKNKLQYIIFKIDGLKIVVDSKGAKGKTFDDFVRALPDAQCRYAVFDKEFTSGDGRSTSKMYFLTWMPQVCKQKMKMSYTTERPRCVSHARLVVVWWGQVADAVVCVCWVCWVCVCLSVRMYD